MPRTSHHSSINVLPVDHPGEPHPGNPMPLANAFAEFMSVSARLESSYRHLQQEVYELRQQLSLRSLDLTNSIAENQRMRIDLQQILDYMPCGVLVLGSEGAISMINPESGKLLGLDVFQMQAALYSSLSQLSALSGINLTHLASHPGAIQEICLSQPSGKRWLEARNRPLFGQTILILRDITAQKRAEQEREAARAAMTLAEITTILAHEVRNPLASLELFAGLIEDDPLHRPQWVTNLRVGIRTLSATVNNVLTFHGAGLLPLAPLSLAEAITPALQFVLPSAQQADVSLHWDPQGDPALVMGNESALRQVTLNLMANAIRHTGAGGSVAVELRCVDAANGPPMAAVSFADTGCGLRVDQLDRIFEPGFSGTGDTSGLGLAVCQRIMHQHHGRIAASNRPQGGAQFIFSLPLLQAQAGVA